MDNMYYISALYDYYGNLLTIKQCEYFEDYYFNNLTLQEISANNKVSRNAVHKSLNTIIKKLEFYESKLELYKKRKEIELIINELEEPIKNKINELI